MLPAFIAYTGAIAITPAAAVPITLEDDAGPDDEPGQKDLNSLTVDQSPPTPNTVDVTWNWDYAQTDLSGGNTADACSLFDTDGDGNADYSLCVIWGDDGDDTNGTDNTYITTRLYSCGDDRADRCSQPASLLAEDMNGDGDLADAGEALSGGPYATTCSITFGVADTFGARGNAQADDTTDTQASCQIALSDVSASDAFLLNVCSYPSQEPNSDPSDCVITPNRGFLTIIKVADPDDNTVDFQFNLPPAATFIDNTGQTPDVQGPYEFTISGSGTEALISVNEGTWDLTEVVPSGWQLDSASCVGPDGATGTLNGNTMEAVAISTGQETVCTFNNSLSEGTLTLNKIVDNLGQTGPGYLTVADFPLAIDGSPTTSGTPVTVAAGSHTISETGQAGYTVGTWTCSDGTSGVAGETSFDVNVPAGGSVSCDITNTLIANPSLAIEKTVLTIDGVAPGDGGVANSPGDIIVYQVVVTNTGNVDLSPGVSDVLTQNLVEETLAMGDPVESEGDDDVMEPGETWTYTFDYEVTQIDLDDGGDLINEACASNADPAVAEVCDNVVTPLELSPAASVAKSTSTTYYSAAGEVIDYTIAITNEGNVSLSEAAIEATLSDELNGVDVTASLAGAFTDAAGANPVGAGDTLAPGGTWYYTYSYTTQESDLADGASVTNVVCVNVDGGDPECDTVETPQAGLDIVKTVTSVTGGNAAGEVDSVGDVINYEVVVTNTGDTDLAPSVTDTISQAGVGNLTLDAPGLVGPAESGTEDGVLEPGETWTYTASYTVTQADLDAGGNIGNQACASNTDPAVAEECSNVETPVDQNPDATVSKSADVDYYSAVGDEINYTITVNNSGNVALSEADISPTLIDTLNGDPVVLAGPFTNSDGTGAVGAGDTLAPGGNWYYTYTYTVDADDFADGASVTNVVCIDVDGDGTEQCDTVDTPQAGLDIVKTVTSVTGGNAAGEVDSAGDIINYQVVVTNTGGVDLTPAVSDFLSQDGVGSNYSLIGPSESLSDNLVLNVGETWTFTLQYEASQANINNGSDIVNEACASDDDPLVAEECSTVNTPIAQNPSLAITKDVDLASISDPATLSYDVVVTNDGNVDLSPTTSDVVNQDGGVNQALTLTRDDATDVNSDNILSPGESWSYTASYDADQDDIDNGNDLVNTACAMAPGVSPPRCAEAITSITQNPAMSVEKTVNLEQISGPTTLNYTIVVTNDGNVTMFPAMNDILTASGVDQTIDLGAPTESVNTNLALDVGETWTFNFSYNVTQDDIDNGSDILNVVCIADPADDDDCDDTTTTITQTPGISILKTGEFQDANGDGNADVGETITYTFRVENTGNVTLTNVTVDDPLITVNGGPITLAPDEVDTATFTGTYIIDQDDIDAGQVYNQAFATGDCPDGTVDCASDDDDHTEPLPQVPGLEIIKTGEFQDENGDGNADAGETISYSFTVTNTGNVTLSNVTVTDPLVSVSGGPITLGPGDSDSTTFTATYVVQQVDIDAGNFYNQAFVTGDCPDATEDCAGDDDDHDEPLTQDPSILIVKDGALDLGADGIATPGDVINYTFDVTNNGNVTLTNVVVTDPLVTNVDCGVDGTGLIGTLAPEASVQCTGSLTIDQDDIDAGVKNNLADVDGTDPNGVPVNDDDPHSEPIPQVPSIDLVKTASDIDMTVVAPVDRADEGDQITYTFEITNTGNVTLTGVDLDDALVGLLDATCGGITELAPGQSTDCQETHDLTQAEIDAGEATNNASACGDAPIGPEVCDDDTTTTPIDKDPSILIVKNGDLDLGADGIATPGDVINYTFDVTNTGNVSLSNVVVSDPLISDIDCGDGTATIGGMAPGATVECTGSYAIDQIDIDAGVKDNVADADGTDPDDEPVNDDDDHSEPIPQVPSISLDKTASTIDMTVAGPEDRADVGDQITYSFEITNTGNVTLIGVDLDDDLLVVNDITCGVTELAPGQSTTCEEVYTLTLDDLNNGSVSNDADACGDAPDNTEVCDGDGTTTTIPQVPLIDLVKTASAVNEGVVAPNDRTDVGDQITYSFEITNVGNVTLTGVDLDDDLVGHNDFICNTEVLNPGDSTTCQTVYTLTLDDLNAGSVTNNADACGDAPDATEVCDVDTTTTPIEQEPAIDLVKSASAIDETIVEPADRTDAGDQITYSFEITNVGNVTLTGVDLDDDLVGHNDFVCNTEVLNPGDSTTCQTVYDLTQDDIDAGSVTNNADACGDDPNGAEVCDDDTTTTDIEQLPSINLDKTASAIDTSVVAPNDRADAGDQITYSFEITNTGNVTLTGVDLDDALVQYADATCGVTELAPGASTTCQAVYDLTLDDLNAGTVSNSANACGDAPDGTEVCDDDGTTTDIPQEASIDLEKEGNLLPTRADGFAQAGDTIFYTFQVTNTGSVTLTDLVVTDSNIANVTCPTTTLIPGAMTVCSGEYNVTQADIDAGFKDNTAEAEGVPPASVEDDEVMGDADSDGNPDDTDTFTVPIPRNPAHTLTKTFADEEIGAGETSTFTLVYTNTGNVTLTGVSITDTVDTLLDVQSVVSLDGANCDDSTGQFVDCSVATMLPGEQVSITVTYNALPLVGDLIGDNGETSGSNYVFYFENGYVLYGSTDSGDVTLIGPDGVEVPEDDPDTPWSVEGRNQDIFFNAPDGDSFQIHLSCSQVFIDGYGDTGPTEADNPQWKIDAYQVWRFNTNGFFKDCGQTFAPFYVTNTAYASANPPAGTTLPDISASDDITVVNIAPIEVTRERFRRGAVEIQYFNTSQDDITIDIIRVEWTDGSVLESASYQDGVDLGISGSSAAEASIETSMPARSKDWLKLNFVGDVEPDGLTVTIVTSTGATFSYDYQG